MACLTDFVQGLSWMWTFNTAAVSNSTASAGWLSGAGFVVFNNSGGTPGNLTTRTGAQMVSDTGLGIGQQYLCLIVNGQATGTMTLVAGDGNVTISGTATIAPNTARLYLVQITGGSTIKFTNQFSFTATALAYGA
jgi:hypothetical protein